MLSTINLVIAPHPDDEVLGCGGVIKRLTNLGLEVFILIMTRGKREKYPDEKITRVRSEALQAHELLNVTDTKFLDFPAPDLDTVPLAEISTAIANIIMELRAETIFIPHRGDIHHDHKVVYNAAMVASRPVDKSPVRRIFTYETLSETEWATPYEDEYFMPNTFVDITDVITHKIEAMKCYESQIRDFPNPRSIKAISALSNYRGSTVGFEHAEAFTLIRSII